MSADDPIVPGVSRRQFLATTAAAAAVTALPLDLAWAQGSTASVATAKYRRINVNSSAAAAVLASYKKAITRSLALPPSDPRNWYRNAFTHLLDCPHGNWWLLPWHRGFTGWWEQICRDLSGDASFAFPYWDWTANPQIPASFFTGVLDPSNSAFISSYTAFYNAFKNPMSDFWRSLSPAQLTQLSDRGYTSVNVIFNDPDIGAKAAFFPPGPTRNHTSANPGFTDPATIKAVSLKTLLNALRTKTFTDFGSDPAAQHSLQSGSGILESQPHNLVHNDVGGFMEDFLSPVDPIFFMHHSNIDRIWDVWTRKQQKLGGATLPPKGTQLDNWSKEPFLFFSDASGKPVTKNKAGDYATIGDFDYDYEPGSGEQVVPTAARPMAIAATASAAPEKEKYFASIHSAALAATKPGTAEVRVPAALLENARVEDENGQALYIRVAIEPPPHTRGARFHVLLNPPDDASWVDYGHPSYVGTIEFFGHPHHNHGSVTFTLAATDAVQDLRASDLLKSGEPLRIQVVPQSRGVALRAQPPSSLKGVSVGAY
ncbi:MAG: tyrosinase [Acidobacteria bacterium]|nr:tyrosinase [Acidobacteriota bacterium]